MSIRLAVLGWVAAWGFCWAAAPSVTNVQAAQRRGTPYVDIGYDLSGSGTDLNVTVAVSTNGGAVYFTPASGLSGDVGRGVAQGSGKKMVWNAGAALSAALYNNVRVKVTAGDAPSGMVLIPAGTNSGTDPDLGAYSLTVAAFYMDATEVTKAQWDAVYTWAVANGYGFDNAGSGKASNHPVQTVNWYDCAKWCNARSEKDGRTPCYTVGGGVYKTGSYGWDGSSVVVCDFAASGYRLPTNTEWEYAARGGQSGRRFPWGDTIDHSRANYYGYPSVYAYDLGYEGFDTRYATGDYPYTSPAGAFAANGYGLYDMAGNVWEWCNDTSGSYRNFRGGSWFHIRRLRALRLQHLGLPGLRLPQLRLPVRLPLRTPMRSSGTASKNGSGASGADAPSPADAGVSGSERPAAPVCGARAGVDVRTDRTD